MSIRQRKDETVTLEARLVRVDGKFFIEPGHVPVTGHSELAGKLMVFTERAIYEMPMPLGMSPFEAES